MATDDEDEINMLVSANSHDTLLFFTDHGKVYQQKVYQIPEAGRTAKGVLLAGIMAIGPEEHVTAMVNVPDFEEARYVMMITRQGYTKRVSLKEFESVRPSGLIAIRLVEGDELGWVRLTQGTDELILVTEQGQGIRFSEKDVRAMGRTARGVRGMRLNKGDRVAVAEVIEPDGKLFLSSSRGFGRCTPLEEFRAQHRGGKGVRAYKVSNVTGPIADGRIVQDEDELTLMSEDGIILRTKVLRIPEMGRYTRGVHMMDLKDGDRVASIARLFNDQDAAEAEQNEEVSVDDAQAELTDGPVDAANDDDGGVLGADSDLNDVDDDEA
jgi:DNA gyrase subunit A